MEHVQGKTAVITGAASGIGRAMARTFGEAGMRVVMADVEGTSLEQARKDVAAAGIEAVAHVCDVSQADAVSGLAEVAKDAFGGIHVVCNNAGVFAGGTTWGTPSSDYEWVINVNIWGVIHGLQTFVPILLEQDEPGHVVNTASMAGLTTGPMTAAYFMSKHAVVSMSESLFHELKAREAKVGVSVVCPELVDTRIGEAERNRPHHLKRDDEELPNETKLVEAAIKASTPTGVEPKVLAERALAAIQENQFWVLPPDGDPWRRAAKQRCDDIVHARNPTLAGPAAGD